MSQKSSPRRRKNFRFIFWSVCFAVLAAGIVGGVMLVQAASKTPSAEEIYQEVQSYNYDNGRNRDLESKIKQAEQASVDSAEDYTAHNYALKAKIEYYYHIYKYHTVISALQELEGYTIDYDDQAYIALHYAETYAALGNTKSAEEYQAIYDDLTFTCGGGTDEDE